MLYQMGSGAENILAASIRHWRSFLSYTAKPQVQKTLDLYATRARQAKQLKSQFKAEVPIQNTRTCMPSELKSEFRAGHRH